MKKRSISIIILVFYIAILIKVMVFKDIPLIKIGQLMLNFGGTDTGHSPNFIPFKTILPYLMGYKGFIIASINLVGNVILLVPLGLIVPFVSPGITWKRILLFSVLSGLIIETMQVILRVGIFDIDDVILNAFGFMIGYWTLLIISSWMREKKYRNIILSFLLLFAAAGSVFYYVYPKDLPTNTQTGVVDVDPCNGTGGTGEITALGIASITLKRNDDTVQIITLTGDTVIRNSLGPVTKVDLKVGDRVTVVIDESETASIVLVCKEQELGISG